jgi:Ras-related protein Rab-18
MERWFEEAESNAIPGAIMYLVGSKMDKLSSRAVKYEEGEALAAQHGSQFCEVSSKTRENVRKPFIEIVDQIVKNPQLLNTSTRRGGTVGVGGSTEDLGSGCSC